MIQTVLNATSPAQQGFSATNLIVVIAVFAIAFPLVTWLRRRVSEQRRERWAREDAEAQARLDAQDHEN